MACFRLRALWPERSATLFQIALVLVASEDAPFTKAKKRTKLVTEIVHKSDACTETVEVGLRGASAAPHTRLT
jgi:hypothetical protein